MKQNPHTIFRGFRVIAQLKNADKAVVRLALCLSCVD